MCAENLKVQRLSRCGIRMRRVRRHPKLKKGAPTAHATSSQSCHDGRVPTGVWVRNTSEFSWAVRIDSLILIVYNTNCIVDRPELLCLARRGLRDLIEEGVGILKHHGSHRGAPSPDRDERTGRLPWSSSPSCTEDAAWRSFGSGALTDARTVQGRPVLLVDDIVSSGGTLVACTRNVIEAGDTSVDAIVTYVLLLRHS